MHSRKHKKCEHKIRHFNYLTAIQHAAQLEQDERLNIYPCPTFSYIHVEHSPRRTKKKRIAQHVVSTAEQEHIYAALSKTRRKLTIAMTDANRDLGTGDHLRRRVKKLRKTMYVLRAQLRQTALAA